MLRGPSDCGPIDGVYCIVLFALAALLIAPLFGIEYFDNWGSIDSTFIADARFLREHWPHPLWQPLWYCGTRFDYIYPPALRYGTAGTAILANVSTARAYHLYTALLYCLGIVGTYLLVRTVARTGLWGTAAAAGVATLSPCFLFLQSFRDDAALHMPQRLNVLIKWGEGPHISALSLLPFALVFAWRGMSSRDPIGSVLAALFCSMVVAHNFYGAVALAILFSVMAWSIWVTTADTKVVVRAFSMALLAYGLTAFWLTPSYLKITIDNLKFVAQPGNAWSRWAAVAVTMLFLTASWKFGHRRERRAYSVFLYGSVTAFVMIVAGHHYFGFRVIGEPHRFVPELDFVLILGAVEILRRLGDVQSRWIRVGFAVLIIAIGVAGREYLLHPWSVFIPEKNFENRMEFQLTKWISQNLPDSRVFATGSLRLWYNAWHNGAQVGGGSEQGLLNWSVPVAQWQVTKDTAIGRDVAWLKALGADAVVVPDPDSGTLFLDYAAPGKFTGLLPVLYDTGNGIVIYKVPRGSANRARIVKTAEAEMLRLIPFLSNDNVAELEAYVKHLETGADRIARTRWQGTETIVIDVLLDAGESVVIQETYDPSWQAYSGSKRLEIRRDAIGFMRVYAPPGNQELRLIFKLPIENVIGRGLTVASMLLSGLLVLRRLRSARRNALTHA